MRHLTGEFFKHKYCRELFETSGLNPVWWSELKLLIGVPFPAGSRCHSKATTSLPHVWQVCVLTGCLRQENLYVSEGLMEKRETEKRNNKRQKNYKKRRPKIQVPACKL